MKFTPTRLTVFGGIALLSVAGFIGIATSGPAPDSATASSPKSISMLCPINLPIMEQVATKRFSRASDGFCPVIRCIGTMVN